MPSATDASRVTSQRDSADTIDAERRAQLVARHFVQRGGVDVRQDDGGPFARAAAPPLRGRFLQRRP